jgi:hypothetical protein
MIILDQFQCIFDTYVILPDESGLIQRAKLNKNGERYDFKIPE